MRAVRVFAAINQKGGVGKTTTVANLGAAMAARGRDICLMDLDPQSHLTLHLNAEPGHGASTYDLLVADADLKDVAATVDEHLWLAPAEIDLAAAETELANVPDRQQILARRIARADVPFDYMMIDCPPSLGLLTLNALAAADDVLIPLQPHFLALQGVAKLLETISLVQHRVNPKLRVGGVVLCMHEQTTRLAAEVVDELRAYFESAREANLPWSDAKIFQSVVRRNIKLAECPSHGQTIFQYEPTCHGAEDYGALADELLAWMDAPAPPDAIGPDVSEIASPQEAVLPDPPPPPPTATN